MQRRPNSREQGPRPTTLVVKRERPGGNPVFQNIGAVSAAKDFLRCSLPGGWTDSKPGSRVYALRLLMSVIASTPHRWVLAMALEPNNEQVATSHPRDRPAHLALRKRAAPTRFATPTSSSDRPPGSASGDHQPIRRRRAS
jgi:hypothetical protein